jgi:hypothetical protein
LILIKELYELHLAPSSVKTQEEINKEKREKYLDWMMRDLDDNGRKYL